MNPDLIGASKVQDFSSNTWLPHRLKLMRSSENSDLLHHASFETAGALQAAQVLVGVVSEIGSPIVVSDLGDHDISAVTQSQRIPCRRRGSHAASKDLMPNVAQEKQTTPQCPILAFLFLLRALIKLESSLSAHVP